MNQPESLSSRTANLAHELASFISQVMLSLYMPPMLAPLNLALGHLAIPITLHLNRKRELSTKLVLKRISWMES